MLKLWVEELGECPCVLTSGDVTIDGAMCTTPDECEDSQHRTLVCCDDGTWVEFWRERQEVGVVCAGGTEDEWTAHPLVWRARIRYQRNADTGVKRAENDDLSDVVTISRTVTAVVVGYLYEATP